MSVDWDRFHTRANFRTTMSLINLATPLDMSNGRAQLINGDMFFSPTCHRDVKLPPPSPPSTPERNAAHADIEEFLQPQWWSPDFGYLAFLPLHPKFRGYPFGALLGVEHYIGQHGKDQFALPTEITLSLARLELDLKNMIGDLLDLAGAQPPTYPVHTALGGGGFHDSEQKARLKATRMKRWFALWMGTLSYAFALVQTRKKSSLDDIPEWFHRLSKKWPQSYLSCIQASEVTSFSRQTDRVGVFLDILTGHSDQYSPDWLMTFNVPFWYRWGRAEASQRQAHVARLTPPPELLQAAAPVRHKSPTLPATTATAHAQPTQASPPTPAPAPTAASCSSHVPPALPTTTEGQPPWVALIDKKKQALAKFLQTASRGERESVLARQRKPPTTRRVKIFIWEQEGPDAWKREPLTLGEAANYWEDHCTKETSYYDPLKSEWDFFEPVGAFDLRHLRPPSPSDPDEVDDMPPPPHFGQDWSPPSPTSELPTRPLPLSPVRTSGLSAPSPLPSTSGSGPPPLPSMSGVAAPPLLSTPLTLSADNELEIAMLHFGFIRPLASTSSTSASEPAYSDKEVLLVRKTLGVTQLSEAFKSSGLTAAVKVFLDDLRHSRAPANHSWDLAMGGPYTFQSYARLPCFRRVREDLFLFEHPNPTVPWTLALRHAADVIFLCRNGTNLDEQTMAMELLEKGIKFHTLVPRWSASPAPLPQLVPPFRIAHTFTADDFNAYQQQRALMLMEPRVARAALMSGGIIWRLAMQTLGFDVVLEGPSAATTLHQQGRCFALPGGPNLWDDALSESEAAVICGEYCSYSGVYGQRPSRASWWPLEDTWKGHVADQHWTAEAEAWFTNRLARYEAGLDLPLGVKEWGRRLRPHKDQRKTRDFYAKSASAALEDYFNHR